MSNNTKGMNLAAGFGTRLGTLTKDMPKCLVDINGKPMLQHVIEKFINSGITSIAINVHYLADKIEEFLNQNNNFGIQIYLSHEDTILGTGGGIKKAKEFLKDADQIVVHNSDVYSDVSLENLIEFHLKTSAFVTLGVMHRETERPLLFTKKVLNEEQSQIYFHQNYLYLCGWENSKKGIGEVFGNDGTPTTLAFSGIQVISSKIFEYMEDETGEFSSIRTYIKVAKANEKVLGYVMDNNYWIDMGTPEKLSELRKILNNKDKSFMS